MAKGTGKFLIGAGLGALLILHGGETKNPGSSADQVNALQTSGANLITGGANLLDSAIVAVGPLAADARASLQQTGIGDALNGSGQQLPPAQQP